MVHSGCIRGSNSGTKSRQIWALSRQAGIKSSTFSAERDSGRKWGQNNVAWSFMARRVQKLLTRSIGAIVKKNNWSNETRIISFVSVFKKTTSTICPMTVSTKHKCDLSARQIHSSRSMSQGSYDQQWSTCDSNAYIFSNPPLKPSWSHLRHLDKIMIEKLYNCSTCSIIEQTEQELLYISRGVPSREFGTHNSVVDSKGAYSFFWHNNLTQSSVILTFISA